MKSLRISRGSILPATATATAAFALSLAGPAWPQTPTEQLSKTASKAIVDGVFGLFAKKPAAQASSPAADKVDGVVLATASSSQVARGPLYPEYRNGVELLTKPDPDNTGVSELLRAGVFVTYKNNRDIQSAAEHAFKAKADSLEAVRLGKKVSDAQFYKYSVAEECMAQVVSSVTHLDTSDGFEWESAIFEQAYPTEVAKANKSLEQALANYNELTMKYGAQFEARKAKLKHPPANLAKACAEAGVSLGNSAATAGTAKPSGSATVIVEVTFTKQQLVTRSGEPTDLGIAQGYQDYVRANQRRLVFGQTVPAVVSNGRNLGCKADGRNWICDWSAIVKPGSGEVQVGHNRFVWTDTRWAFLDM